MPDVRWRIVYASYEGTERFALETLYRRLQEALPYTVVAVQAEAPGADDGGNLLLIGTQDKHPMLRKLADAGFYTPETRKEGYSLRVGSFGGRTVAVIQGADPSGVLYGADDFLHRYLDQEARFHGYLYNGPLRLFRDPMPDYAEKSAPAVENRGLWTWGHVIRDYRGYLDHMALWKLNTAILWNDFRPVNASEIVQYAHDRGIRVVWGFTWCWGETVDPNDPAQLPKWKARVLDTYESQYAGCGDGIYFQTFTETSETAIGGVPIAELAVAWVNTIAGELLARHPGLWLQFGLHASSIRERADVMAEVDERVTIVWEDAGDFPYAYDPRRLDQFPETLAYQDRLASLRGERERFGAVLKGFSLINWTQFEHQQGPFLLGESTDACLQAWAEEKKLFFDFAKGWWIRSAPLLRAWITHTLAHPLRECTVTALVEDSAWEVRQWSAVCLFAALLWDNTSPTEEIVRRILQEKECE